MIHTINNWLLRVWRWYRHRSLYIIADATDNSITISKGLFRYMDVINLDVAKVFVFRLCNTIPVGNKTGTIYAFMLNPALNQPTQLADIQYNAKHKCIGFECLVPTVNRIFYDYGIPAGTRAKLSIQPTKNNNNEYFIIFPPC
jgi:hypothetical protein